MFNMKEQSDIFCSIGAVVIGRNEGKRLERCFLSLKKEVGLIVYVDSGSTDDSIKLAEFHGIKTVSLDMTKPFTAARARNEGFYELLKLNSDCIYVQFVDGDCEVVSGWIQTAISNMQNNPGVAVVCGRRRERYPEKTIYNNLCDIEWETPIGSAKACGGDALYRVEAFQSVNGFRSDIIAGEEPELCFRLREASWSIWRIDAEMTLHDANITKFSQWWKRAVRCGHAYAEGMYLHGKKSEAYKVRETMRNVIWGILLPLLILLLSIINGWFLLLALLYPLQILKIRILGDFKHKNNWIYTIFLVLSRFPESYGQIKYWVNRVLKKPSNIIEYK